jgi:hypothetical protein
MESITDNRPHTFVDFGDIKPSLSLNGLSTDDQQILKITVIASKYHGVGNKERSLQKFAFVKMVLNYEWNHEFVKEDSHCLETLLSLIDRYASLFPVSFKLENMLREAYPLITKDIWVNLVHNNELIDLCNDIGFFNKNEKGYSIMFVNFTPIYVRKGLYRKDYHRLCLYIKAVMITT